MAKKKTRGRSAAHPDRPLSRKELVDAGIVPPKGGWKSHHGQLNARPMDPPPAKQGRQRPQNGTPGLSGRSGVVRSSRSQATRSKPSVIDPVPKRPWSKRTCPSCRKAKSPYDFPSSGTSCHACRNAVAGRRIRFVSGGAPGLGKRR